MYRNWPFPAPGWLVGFQITERRAASLHNGEHILEVYCISSVCLEAEAPGL